MNAAWRSAFQVAFPELRVIEVLLVTSISLFQVNIAYRPSLEILIKVLGSIVSASSFFLTFKAL